MAWLHTAITGGEDPQYGWRNTDTGEISLTNPMGLEERLSMGETLSSVEQDYGQGIGTAGTAPWRSRMEQLWNSTQGSPIQKWEALAQHGPVELATWATESGRLSPQDLQSSGAWQATVQHMVAKDNTFGDDLGKKVIPASILGAMTFGAGSALAGAGGATGTTAATTPTFSTAGGMAGGELGLGAASYGTGASVPATTTFGTGGALGGAYTVPTAALGTGGGTLASLSAGTGATSPGVVGTSGGGGGLLAGGGASGGAGVGSGLGGILSNPQVLGALGGAALGGLSGSGGKTGTIQTEEGIPDWLMPYVKPTLDKYSTDVQNYQVDPYGIMPSAMKEFQNTISGMYLDPSTNKYLEDYFRLGAERIKGSLSPTFGHMQAFGAHTGYNEALSRGLGDFSVGLYGGAYEKERDRQNQMVGAAPAFLGQSSQAAFAPYSQYLSSVGNLGKKKEQPYQDFSNPWTSVLGGAMVGSQLGNLWK